MKPTLTEVCKTPMQYLYMFCSDQFIDSLESKRARIIRQKRANAQKIVNTMAIDQNSNLDTWAAAIRQAIIDETGKTPAEVLIALANGETVAGKNWNGGIYGVGTTPQLTFSQNAGVTVDPSTGLMSGSGLSTQTPIYNSAGQVIGYSTLSQDGKLQYQSTLYNGQYAAYSFGSADGTAQYANGNKFDLTMVQSIFQSINTLIPYVSSLINTILASLGKTAISYSNTAPAQSDWVEQNDNSGLLLLGAAAAGAFILLK